MNCPLQIWIAIDENVGLPQVVPGGPMIREQGVQGGGARSLGAVHFLFDRSARQVAPDGHILGEGVRAARLDRHLDLQGDELRRVCNLYPQSAQPLGQRYRGGFGHLGSVYCTATDPQ